MEVSLVWCNFSAHSHKVPVLMGWITIMNGKEMTPASPTGWLYEKGRGGGANWVYSQDHRRRNEGHLYILEFEGSNKQIVQCMDSFWATSQAGLNLMWSVRNHIKLLVEERITELLQTLKRTGLIVLFYILAPAMFDWNCSFPGESYYWIFLLDSPGSSCWRLPSLKSHNLPLLRNNPSLLPLHISPLLDERA